MSETRTLEPVHPMKDETTGFLITKAENGYIPDKLLRMGVCKILRDLSNVELAPCGPKHHKVGDFIKDYMRTCDDIAIETDQANEQHYELPHEFFTLCLGDNFKYSQGYWPEIEECEVSENPSNSLLRDVIIGTSSVAREFEKEKTVREQLTQAEARMLKITMERAEIQDNQCVLDVGCGWGAASIYLLENFPGVKVVSVSNSNAQREFIMQRAQDKNVSDRIHVITCNIAKFDNSIYGKQIEEFLGQNRFDRIISIGMFEHMRNWEKLLNKLTEEWLQETGKIFLDYFAHKSRAYTYEKTTWMGKYFFSGGIMPSYDLLPNLDETIGKTLEIEAGYKVNGRHYAKTCEAWNNSPSMKALICAFLFLAVASATFLEAKPSAFDFLAEEALKKIHVKFNSTEFWEGFNQQLGLISNAEAEACIKVAVYTLAAVHFETQAISYLNWYAAFNASQATASLLDYFPVYCEAPYTAYANYFGAAVEAAEKDIKAFLKQVVENWGEGDMNTITNLTNLIAMILENNDKGAGEALANLVNIGLSSYLPSK